MSLTAAYAEPPDAVFEILRKGERIGFHVVESEETADGLIVSTHVRMRVKFGPIPVYGYAHQAVELWRGGALQGLQSRTEDNGTSMSLSLRSEIGRLIIDGTAWRGAAPQGAAPSSYWNRAVIGAATHINSQNGELIDVETTYAGRSVAPNGEPADRYRIRGTVVADFWYEGERWVGSSFTIDGEELVYRLVDPQSVAILAPIRSTSAAAPSLALTLP